MTMRTIEVSRAAGSPCTAWLALAPIEDVDLADPRGAVAALVDGGVDPRRAWIVVDALRLRRAAHAELAVLPGKAADVLAALAHRGLSARIIPRSK